MATDTATGKLTEGIAETPSAVQAEGIFTPEYLAEEAELEKRLIEEGANRIRQSCERAMALGVIDKDGNLLKRELPADMLPDADRDFGG
jgi:hypothetical protein